MTFRYQKGYPGALPAFREARAAAGDDLTVLFAENGGGKTGILHALATGLTPFPERRAACLKLDALRDVRKVTFDDRGRREAAGPASLSWTARVGAGEVTWSIGVNPASGRKTAQHNALLTAIESVRVPGARWPLFAFYGVDRMGRGSASTKPAPSRPDRWGGLRLFARPHAGRLGAPPWLLEEILADTVRRQNDEPERFLATAVMDTLAKATPGVMRAWYDPKERSPMVRFEGGHTATWRELSDGFHVYLALVADIARRAVMLNESDGGEASALVEGVVLIDEIDLHLHPRWQRVALDGLRKVFPRLQFVVTIREAVELALGQGVGALVLDGVLRGDDQERRRQVMGLAVDGDLALGHGLEQGRLRLGRGPVDLVGQDHVGEHRTLAELELAGAPVPHVHADHVGRGGGPG